MVAKANCENCESGSLGVSVKLASAVVALEEWADSVGQPLLSASIFSTGRVILGG